MHFIQRSNVSTTEKTDMVLCWLPVTFIIYHESVDQLLWI